MKNLLCHCTPTKILLNTHIHDKSIWLNASNNNQPHFSLHIRLLPLVTLINLPMIIQIRKQIGEQIMRMLLNNKQKINQLTSCWFWELSAFNPSVKADRLPSPSHIGILFCREKNNIVRAYHCNQWWWWW